MTLAPPTDWKVASEHPTLRAGEVHLWRAHLSAADAGELGDLLSPAEWIRAQRFHFPK